MNFNSGIRRNIQYQEKYQNLLSIFADRPCGVSEPFIDAENIADVAVAALTEEGHDGKVYEVSGPRLLTFLRSSGRNCEATGKPIEFQKISMESVGEEPEAWQLPADLIWLITYLFTEVLDGRNEYLSNGVQEALGRKPRDFSEYVKKTVAEGAWG